jgi:hypothetical protein
MMIGRIRNPDKLCHLHYEKHDTTWKLTGEPASVARKLAIGHRKLAIDEQGS